MPRERIVAAAILDHEGKIWSVEPPGRHHNVIALMGEKYQEGRLHDENTQGFLTSVGRFVRRKPALRIAAKAGQLPDGIKRTVPEDQLFSEDLW